MILPSQAPVRDARGPFYMRSGIRLRWQDDSHILPLVTLCPTAGSPQSLSEINLLTAELAHNAATGTWREYPPLGNP